MPSVASFTVSAPRLQQPFGHPAWWWLCALLLFSPTVQASDPQANYVAVYRLIEEADALRDNRQTNDAINKYREAHQQLSELRKWNPSWNTKVVNYRLKYIADQIHELSAPPPVADPAPPAEEPTPSAPPRAASRSIAPSMEITVLDAGTEPHRLLRLRPSPGDRQVAGMTLKTTTDMVMADMPGQNVSLPAVNIVLALSVKDVSPDGNVLYEMEILEAGVAEEAEGNDMLAGVLKSALDGIKGLTSRGTMTSRGVSQKQSVKLSAGTDALMRQQMEQMNEALAGVSLPMPEEPVGPGARWQVRQSLKSQGMTLLQNATYELVSVTGDQLEVKALLEQTAKPQRVANPAMPGMRMDLTQLTGTGTGSFTLDLNRIFPSAAELDSTTDLGMAMNVGGQKQTLTMKMGMHMRWQPR